MLSAHGRIESIIVLMAVALGVSGGADLGWFLSRTPELTSADDLDDFRRVVTRQMYASLVVLGLIAAAILVAIHGFAHRMLTPQEFLCVTTMGGFSFVLVGTWVKRAEAEAKAMPCSDDDLRAQRDRIVEIWMKKALPKW